MRRSALLSAPLSLRLALSMALAFVAVDGVQAQVRERTQIEVARNAAPRADERPPVATSAPATQRFGQPAPLPPVRAPASAETAPVGPSVMSPKATPDVASPDATRPPLPPPVTAEPVPHKLNIVRTAPEQIGQVPSQFMWIRDGLMAARDPLDGSLVYFGDEGRVLGRVKFQNGFDTADIVGQPGFVRLIDFSHQTQITIQRTVDPAAATALTITPNTSDATLRARRLTRRSAQELILNDERQNGTQPLTVRSVAGGQLAQAYEISPGTSDNRFVVTEEIVAVKPALTVRMVVQRFDKDGKLTGVVYVPLDNFEQVPRNFIAVTGAGLARVLRPTVDGVRIDEYDFAAPPRAGNRRLNDSELKSLSRKLREIAAPTTVQGDTSVPFNDGVPQIEVDVQTPPIARSTVLANARAYLNVNWVMQRENFVKPGIDNACEPAAGRYWLRPRRFTEDLIGTAIGPMPYRWGGDDTPATFKLRIEWGALAGSICTCRQADLNYCLVPQAAGIDCSGLVSKAWGIDKRGTSGLLDVATELDSIDALKPGDAFDWPQRHIRLFTGLAEGAATGFTVLEASTRYQCEGVCERVYRPSEMNGYKLIRYKGISETAVVATNGTGKPAQNGSAKPTENSTPAAAGAAETKAKTRVKPPSPRKREQEARRR